MVNYEPLEFINFGQHKNLTTKCRRDGSSRMAQMLQARKTIQKMYSSYTLFQKNTNRKNLINKRKQKALGTAVLHPTDRRESVSP